MSKVATKERTKMDTKVKTDEKPKAKTETAKKEPTPMKEIVTVKAGALQVDVAPQILSTMDKAYKDEAKANEMLAQVASKRYDMLATLTSSILKAAKADDNIDLSVAFSADKNAMTTLNDQLGLALGFREITEVEAKDGSIMRRIGPAKAMSKYFPTAKDAKGTAETKRKQSLRSNFLTMLKKCSQAAAGIMANDVKVTTDKETGTLQISGPAVEKQFGQPTVTLNEKQTVGEGEGAVQLLKKPSFTAVAEMGAAAAGKVLEKRVDSRRSAATSPGVAVQNIAKSLVDACEKLKLPADDETKRALSIAMNAIDKVLQGSQG